MLSIPAEIKKFGDYVPMFLIALLFVAESELHEHALHISLQLALTIFILIVFFIVLSKSGSKKFAILISLVVWIILVFIKNVYIPKKIR